MGQLVEQVQALARGYVRKGGKDNRKQQAARMAAFAVFCETQGAREIGQVGGRHVVRYWLSIRHLSPATVYSHYLALRNLWRLAGKVGLPPAPEASGSTKATQQARSPAKPLFRDVDDLQAVSREAS